MAMTIGKYFWVDVTAINLHIPNRKLRACLSDQKGGRAEQFSVLRMLHIDGLPHRVFGEGSQSADPFQQIAVVTV